jgi:glyoxylase-like metal-dependent hydrolase (beta-lactamase superfamily II)
MQSTTLEVAPGIYLARIPVPFPLKFVNCYLVATPDGWSLIDAGLRYPEAEQAWRRAFDELGLRPDQLRAIYITHYHPDHFGMAGTLQQESGAPVYMSGVEARIAQTVWGQNDVVSSELVDFFRHYGMPAEVVQGVEEQMRAIYPTTLPHPTITPLELGYGLPAGPPVPALGHLPIVYGGHTDGHLCLYEQERQILFSGDHILPRITPNISLWPGFAPNPLDAYLRSLPELEQLDVTLALPAHGAPFVAYRDRLHELQDHHAERLDRMAAEAGAGSTAFQICDAVFAVSTLTPHQSRFAMAETLAHLVYLVQSGRLRQDERAGSVLFSRREA